MKRVSIVNNVNGRTFGAQMEDPTEWIAKQEAKESWGKKDRWTRELEGDHYTNTREVTNEFETYTEYFYPQEYEVIVEDITLEYEEEQDSQRLRQEIVEYAEFVEAVFDAIISTDNTKLLALKSEFDTLKVKYPKAKIKKK